MLLDWVVDPIFSLERVELVLNAMDPYPRTGYCKWSKLLRRCQRGHAERLLGWWKGMSSGAVLAHLWTPRPLP